MSVRFLLLLQIASLGWNTISLAQDTTPLHDSSEMESPDHKTIDVDQNEESEAAQKEKKRQLEIGMILVGGIVILGVFLLVMTLLVSRRLKRTAAQGRQPSQLRDELWYLKNPSLPDRDTSDRQDKSE